MAYHNPVKVDENKGSEAPSSNGESKEDKMDMDIPQETSVTEDQTQDSKSSRGAKSTNSQSKRKRQQDPKDREPSKMRSIHPALPPNVANAKFWSTPVGDRRRCRDWVTGATVEYLSTDCCWYSGVIVDKTLFGTFTIQKVEDDQLVFGISENKIRARRS